MAYDFFLHMKNSLTSWGNSIHVIQGKGNSVESRVLGAADTLSSPSRAQVN